MECITCGQGNPTHYLKDGVCPDCRDAEDLGIAVVRAEEAEAEVERLTKERDEYRERAENAEEVVYRNLDPDEIRENCKCGQCSKVADQLQAALEG